MIYYEMLGYPLMLVAVMEIILGVIVLQQNPSKSPIHKAVAVFAFSSAGYCLFGAIMYLRVAHGVSDIDFFARASWIGWLSIPAALQVLFFLMDEKSRTGRVVGYVLYPFWTIVLLLTLFTDLVEPPGYKLNPYIDQHGPLENPARAIGGVLVLWIIVQSWVLQRRTTGIRKQQIIHFAIGTAIFSGGALILAALVPLSGGFGLDPGLGAFFSFPWAFLTFYAIMRYSLFDIRILLSRTAGLLLLWTCFAALQLVLFHLLTPYIGEDTAIAISLSLIAFTLSILPVNRWAQAWTERIFVRDKYRYQDALNNSIKAILTILDQKKLMTFIVESIRKSLGADAVYLYWADADGRMVRREGYGPLMDSGGEASLSPEIAAQLGSEGRPVLRDEPSRIPQKESDCRIDDCMRAIGADLMVPLACQGTLNGVLALGRKNSREPYRQSDLDLLGTLAGHAAVAMANANLYEETRQAREEKEKILRDLHDGIGGITTNINLLAQMCIDSGSLVDIRKALSIISSLAQEGLADVRGLLHSLDVKDMSWQSLAAQLRRQGSGLIEPHGISFKLSAAIDNKGRPPGSLFCLHLFKIYNESLLNIIKHSRARSVEVSLDITARNLLLTIADNGIGYDTSARKGRGLANMTSRAAELGGRVSAATGNGTTVQIELPLSPAVFPAATA